MIEQNVICSPLLLPRRYVFLFNSLVLCCKSKGQFYHFKAAIDLDQLEYTLEDVPSPDSVSKGDQDDKVAIGRVVVCVCVKGCM